ncbi:sulfotransferase family 2 domain-containing protein [Starkeya sp. ORNL1]|uniref:sulfotransferase family 2 domain-containing protein n=1 Tax=Starkeya sp. ORNL1 TaxID=2709380 RepID=UPI001FEED7BA|nr:sulfotransferase family 2 domain-containing protein [Starkeya sp. ORNL1]
MGAVLIISYRRKFTFLHCPKTAGSSINLALAPHLGPLDIILGAQRERLQMGMRPNLRARLDTFQTRRFSAALTAMGMRSQQTRRILSLQDKKYHRHFGPLVDHPTATQVRRFDERAWRRHFKFTFVRNPYARMASLYFYLTRKSDPPRMEFQEFLCRLKDGDDLFKKWSHLVSTWSIYTIDDQIAVDFVGRYENLDADFASLCEHLNIPGQSLKQTKVGPRYNYCELYDENTRLLVGQLCGSEIEHFGYRFDGPLSD